MGEVYRADDLKLGQPVALKFLPEALERDAERLERFLGEVRIARQVAHPNVCRTYDVGEVDGRHYLSMEYVDGEDLASLARRIGRLPEDKSLQLARQLCAGLAALHEQGILHRDLKPANVMIDGRGSVKITDFGLAAFAAGLQRAEVRVGTPAYMAPEQLAGTGVSVRSDVYSLGLVLYELFGGRPAFDPAASFEETARRRREEPPTPLGQLVSHLDPAVETTIASCLETDPGERPPSALAVSAALPGGDPLAEALAAGETPSPELVAASGRTDAMRPVRAAALALVAAAAFLAAARLDGARALRAWVPLDKPPEVLVDRSREIVARLGYTEPVYAEPADRAFGFDVWPSVLREIERRDASPRRWERLTKPEVGAVTYWYRQSPHAMLPNNESFGTFAGGPVTRWNPFPEVTGMILVSLDTAGKLRFFAHTPRRFVSDPAPRGEVDWSLPFELAGLDPAAFRQVEPAYQRFADLDSRAAWVGEVPGLAGAELRIEAGTQGGRIALWGILEPAELERLASEPQRSEAVPVGRVAFHAMVLLVLAASTMFARHNLNQGRGDRRGTIRIATFFFALTCARELLHSHALFTYAGMTQIYPIVATGLFYAAFSAALYLAIEPYARRTWPAMLVSWVRLLGRSARNWRDPRIGRSVLWGTAAGALLALARTAAHGIRGFIRSAPDVPDIGEWDVLLGFRHALAAVTEQLYMSTLQAFVLVFLLVMGRRLLRGPWAAAAFAGVVWVLLYEPVQASLSETSFALVLVSLRTALFMVVLLRQGVLALIASLCVVRLEALARTADWSAWHAEPSLYVTALVLALAGYGFWAASAAGPLAADPAAGRPALRAEPA
jgi:serine/threonine-protein kinase